MWGGPLFGWNQSLIGAPPQNGPVLVILSHPPAPPPVHLPIRPSAVQGELFPGGKIPRPGFGNPPENPTVLDPPPLCNRNPDMGDF